MSKRKNNLRTTGFLRMHINRIDRRLKQRMEVKRAIDNMDGGEEGVGHVVVKPGGGGGGSGDGDKEMAGWRQWWFVLVDGILYYYNRADVRPPPLSPSLLSVSFSLFSHMNRDDCEELSICFCVTLTK